MKFILTIIGIIIFPLRTFASDFPAKEVYENFSPSVVLILASETNEASSMGAGSVISKEGFILTNAHVVVDSETEKPYSKIELFIKPENLTGIAKNDLRKYVKAVVLSYSNKLDLALLKIDRIPLSMNIIEMADPLEIKVGEEVVAIGHPEQGGFWSLTYGRISGSFNDHRGISGKDTYQTDTSVNRGNSGGPLLDRRGYIVGVNSSIARLGKGGLPITGVNFAIKSSVVQKWLAENGYRIAYGTRPLIEEEKKIIAKPPEVFKEKDKKKVSGVKQKVPEPVIEKKKIQEKKPTVEKKEDRFVTPKRPYDYDDLVKAAEEDLEDMIKEMRRKIRKK